MKISLIEREKKDHALACVHASEFLSMLVKLGFLPSGSSVKYNY